MVRKLSGVVVLLVTLSGIEACGEPEETCTCTCTCGSGSEATLDDAASEDDCSSRCADHCGNDGYSANYDCTTQG